MCVSHWLLRVLCLGEGCEPFPTDLRCCFRRWISRMRIVGDDDALLGGCAAMLWEPVRKGILEWPVICYNSLFINPFGKIFLPLSV